MKQSGVWIVAAVAFLGMAFASLLVLRPLIFRDQVRVVFVESDLDPCPSSDAMRMGFLFAIVERDGKAGRYKVESVLAKRYRAMLSLKNDESEPVFSDGNRAPNIVSVITFQDLPEGVQNPFLTIACLQPDNASGKGPHVLPTLEQQGVAAARWAKRSGVRKVRILGENERLRRAFEAEAGALVGDGEPDLVFFTGEELPYGDATKAFRDLKQKGFRGRFLIADLLPRVSPLDAPGPLEDGCLLVSPLTPPPPQFQAPFEAFAGKRLGPHVYAGTLAGRAVLDALERRRGEEPLQIVLPEQPCGLYVAKNGAFEFVEALR